MSRFVDNKCLHCEHLRYVASKSLATFTELILAKFVPAGQRPFFATSARPNVLTDLILHFKTLERTFDWEQVTCFECTRDEVMERLSRLDDETFVLQMEDLDGSYESVQERVERRGWELFNSAPSPEDGPADNYAELQKVYEKSTSVVDWSDSDV